MNAILGMAHVMRRGNVSSAQSDQLGKIEMAARHLLGVINDILDLAKIDAGKLVTESVPLRVIDIMRNVVLIMEARAIEKNIRLLVDPVLFDSVFYGDQTRLQQVLLNYVSNAINFSKADASGWVRRGKAYQGIGKWCSNSDSGHVGQCVFGRPPALP